MKRLWRSTLVVTLFALAGQAVGFLSQVVLAAVFGAGTAMDAFLAASTLPQYIIVVLLSALSVVFIPVYVGYNRSGNEAEAWKVASAVLTLCTLTMAVLAVAGIILARPLVEWTTPGLAPATIDLAAQVARINWLAVVATGVVSLLTGIYQSQGRFGWPSLVPVIGAVANLALIVALAGPWGVVGVAVAAAVGVTLQVLLLLPIARGPLRFRWSLNWRHPGVIEVLRLLVPLVLGSLVVRFTPVIDRYLAAGQSPGTISHLGYASKMVALVSVLLASGISTVIFPRMAATTAGGDVDGLRATVANGLRMMWVAVAPAIALGIAIAVPLVTLVFHRGAFAADDVASVALLTQIYLLSLAAMCLGNLTGRTLYAMKDMRTVAIGGVIETLAYAVYTPLLARAWGAIGIAGAFVIYYNFSLLWQTIYIWYRLGHRGGGRVMASFLKTSAAAAGGGCLAGVATVWLHPAWLQLACGGILGGAVYVGGLFLLRSREAWHVVGILRDSETWVFRRRQGSG